MLFKKQQLENIAGGKITLAFRKCKRPTVKTGGTLRTPVGVLDILDVRCIDSGEVTVGELVKAGMKDFSELHALCSRYPSGKLYRIEFRYQGEDPRLSLRESVYWEPGEKEALQQKLSRFDEFSRHGPWTGIVLNWILSNPGKRAAEMADDLGLEKEWLKSNVRKLKNLGLTISLGIGYELSPRGKSFLERVGG